MRIAPLLRNRLPECTDQHAAPRISGTALALPLDSPNVELH